MLFLNVLNELDTTKGQTHSFKAIDFRDSNKLRDEVNLLTSDYHILVNNTGGPAAGAITDANIDHAWGLNIDLDDDAGGTTTGDRERG